MTLSVGGTVFCFRAVFMGDPEQQSSEPASSSIPSGNASVSLSAQGTTTAAGGAQNTINATNNSNSNSNSNSNNSDHLVLFSVVVALAPQVDISSIPISGWFEGNEDDKSSEMNHSLHRLCSFTSGSSHGGDGMGSSHGSHMMDSTRASASFLSIRRVQVSLARLCRVLEREERRCRYISLQSNHFFRIRSELQKKWEEKATTASSSSSSKPPTAGSSPKSDFSGKSQVPTDRKKAHRRVSSFSQSLLAGNVSLSNGNDTGKERLNPRGKKDKSDQEAEDLREREQEILEHLLAAMPDKEINKDPRISAMERKHHGNLGRELVQVFHALSRNDHNFPPSPTILSGREGVVYVNRHIAVGVEAASLPKTFTPDKFGNAIVRPYHTLLFPNASPSQLLEALQSSGLTAPLQQLLLMVRPSKPLTDIAVDANLPLATVMELAIYLVCHGACVASPVLTRASRLACKRVHRIQELALDFSQTFDDWSVSLFLIVSFLTANGRTLGESMAALTTGEDPVGSALRAGILSSIFHDEDSDDFVFVEPNHQVSDDDESDSGLESPGTPAKRESQIPNQQSIPHRRAEELEEVLYSMAIWLLSHQVLGHIQDYLVLAKDCTSNEGINNTNHYPQDGEAEKRSNNKKATNIDTTISATAFDDGLLRELQESDCLLGNASIVAMSWRLGLDTNKLRSWAIRHDKLRVISRLAESGDDWGAVC